MKLQFLGTKVEDGVEYAFVLDEETGETLKSPVVEKVAEEPRVRTVREALTSGTEREEVTAPSAVDVPQKVEGGNPHAVPNPQYAWQDPNWVSPEERRARRRNTRPVTATGQDVSKIFREPGKFGDNEIDYV